MHHDGPYFYYSHGAKSFYLGLFVDGIAQAHYNHGLGGRCGGQSCSASLLGRASRGGAGRAGLPWMREPLSHCM